MTTTMPTTPTTENEPGAGSSDAPTTANAPWPALAVRGQKGKRARKLLRGMMRTITAWDLVEPGDKIMVCLSGGKDSYTLFDLLWSAKQRAPFDFDVIGVHLDQVQPGYDGRPFYDWLERFGAPYEILREDTYSLVTAGSKPGQTYCFLCSRLRRGILYAAAERLGCNKLALGHHRDDAVQTLLMNLFYAGKMQAMPARYVTDDGKFTVIRPLVEVAERDIAAFATERGYPIVPCNLCGSQDGLKRDRIRGLLDQLEAEIPDVKSVIGHALTNVRPSHLLDADVERAWRERDPEIRPAHAYGDEEERERQSRDRDGDARRRLGDKDNVVLRGGAGLGTDADLDERKQRAARKQNPRLAILGQSAG